MSVKKYKFYLLETLSARHNISLCDINKNKDCNLVSSSLIMVTQTHQIAFVKCGKMHISSVLLFEHN